MKIIALDYGTKRVGVAVADANSGIAFARDNIKNDHNLFTNILELIEQESVNMLIIGKPLMLDSSSSDSSKKVDAFVQELNNLFVEEKKEISIKMVDERYSTNIAQQRLNTGNCKKRDKREKIDSAAAQVLLENYLMNGDLEI